MDMKYDPVGGAFTGVLPMKEVEKLSYLNSIEDCYRYKADEALGTYYPIRIAPSMEIDMDAEWPVIMPAGTIVSTVSLKDAVQYSSDDDVTGILTSGELAVSVSKVDGSALKKSINYMYDHEVAGFLTICNGGTETTDSYSDDDGTYGILDKDGAVVTSSTTAYTRPANRPVGIVNSRIPADLRLRWLNYDALNSVTMGNHIALGGVLTIPYVIVYGSGVLATVQTAIRGAVDAKHQYAWIQSTETVAATVDAVLIDGYELKSDIKGKFTTFSRSADNDTEHQYFGKVLERRNRVPYNLDEIIDTFPGSGMKGMDTGGLTARLFNFIKSIITASNIVVSGTTGTIAQVKDALYNGYTTDTTDVALLFGQVDVAFGNRK
jgi:hypothetical protein